MYRINLFLRVGITGVFIFYAAVSSQTYWSKQLWSNYGAVNAIAKTPDNNFILAGYSNPNEDILVAKINLFGDTIWAKKYSGMEGAEAKSIITTKQGNYIIAGCLSQPQLATAHIIAMAITPSGDTLWTKEYTNFPKDINNIFATGIAPTSNGDYIISGCASIFGNQSRNYLLCIDEQGREVWSKTFGGIGYSETKAVTVSHDSNIIALGTQAKDTYLYKTRSNGDVVWEKILRIPELRDGFLPTAILPVTDSAYMITGFFYSEATSKRHSILIKIDQNGTLIWNKDYEKEKDMFAYCIAPTDDSNFIITGTTLSNQFHYSAFLLKVDKNGDTLWTKTVENGTDFTASTIQQSQQGQMIVGGSVGMKFGYFLFLDDCYAEKSIPFTFKIPVSGDSSAYTYTPVKVPSGMLVSKSGELSWTPTTDSVYKEHVELYVSNKTGIGDSLNFNIFVNTKKTSVSLPKLISRSSSQRRASAITIANRSHSVQFSVSDKSSLLGIYDIRGCLLKKIALVNGTGTWNYGNRASGQYWVKVLDVKNK